MLDILNAAGLGLLFGLGMSFVLFGLVFLYVSFFGRSNQSFGFLIKASFTALVLGFSFLYFVLHV